MPGDLPTRQGPGGRGARARILHAARVLFGERGITTTGVAELCAAAEVSKRTLYQHFPSKDEVVVAYLQALEEEPARGPEGVLARAELSPRARLLELFAALGEQRHPMRGCAFVNAAVELADPEHPARRFAAEHKRRFTERLTEIARDAGARPAEQVGRRLALLYDGAAAQVAVSDSAEPAAEAYAMAALLLHQAIDL
ncbi:MAG TPA: helix-turn-helix domain-containing protein [Solirubrobacteraceae bacterium]|jgi:AcrR family transcriptional regulator|nr:helix-turn-helix domain-containing protein [Solirubrobacteraceae bacterium]